MFSNQSLFSIFLLFAILLISLSFSSYTVATQESFEDSANSNSKRVAIATKKV